MVLLPASTGRDNITGVANISSELNAKRLELLHELMPTARIAVLVNPNNSNAMFRLKEVEEASRALALPVQVVSANGEDEIDVTLATLLRRGAGALLVVDDPLFNSQRTSAGSALLDSHNLLP